MPQFDPARDKVNLLGVNVHALSLDQLLSAVEGCVLHGRQTVLSNVNIHALNIAYSQPWYRDFLNSCSITFCDGAGIKLAAKLTGQVLLHRFTPPDFTALICERAVEDGWRIFFLGARPGIAQQAADILSEGLPGLQIEAHHGYFEKSFHSKESQQVIDKINRFQPHILFVGFGMPVQERWIEENLPSLKINVALPVGALFDYLSGSLPRAPRWITDHGLEWMGRLIVEPKRLWKRYLIGNPLFYWRIFIHHFLKYPLPK